MLYNKKNIQYLQRDLSTADTSAHTNTCYPKHWVGKLKLYHSIIFSSAIYRCIHTVVVLGRHTPISFCAYYP